MRGKSGFLRFEVDPFFQAERNERLGSSGGILQHIQSSPVRQSGHKLFFDVVRSDQQHRGECARGATSTQVRFLARRHGGSASLGRSPRLAIWLFIFPRRFQNLIAWESPEGRITSIGFLR